MRKRIIPSAEEAGSPPPGAGWLDLEDLAEVEITSEDPTHPIESSLLPGGTSGWRAAGPGEPKIRLLFAQPQAVHRISPEFSEPDVERTQEFVPRWSPDTGRPSTRSSASNGTSAPTGPQRRPRTSTSNSPASPSSN